MPPATRLHPPKSLLGLLLILGPLILGIPWLALRVHYSLPTPLVDTHDATGAPQLSEARMLGVARHLSEDIGYRTVGTREHALADEWIAAQLTELKALCDAALLRTPGRQLQCDIYRQQGSGKHRFDIAHAPVFKSYHGLTNHILRISSGTPHSKAHAVLVNSHVDSTLPSPGAADDAVCVGVMLELIRVLVQRERWEPEWSVIFLFNNAEESLQDASHLFSTQHELASTVRAVINLEAAGTTGPELLFQATSEEMIAAYARVPRPHGSVLANDVFNSGIILSDTDFGQFGRYLNVTGLDMAIVGNSYMYHTRKDVVENIQPGVAQHMAENVLALLDYLTASTSPLPRLTEYTAPATVYYSLLNRYFFHYSYALALRLSLALAFLSVLLALLTTRSLRSTPRALAGILLGFLLALLSSNLIAFLMSSLVHKPLSWFAREWLSIALYAPPALLGAVLAQLLVHPPPARPAIEHEALAALMVFYALVGAAGQWAGVGSSYMYFLNALSLWIAVLANEALVRIPPGFRFGFGKGRGKGKSREGTVRQREKGDVSAWTYAVGQVIPLVAGCEALAGFLDIFVPLDAPVEHIIATIVAFLTIYMLPFVLPFAHRFGRPALRAAAGVLAAVTVGVVVVFAAPGWREFDAMHQNRYFVVHVENITAANYGLHISTLNSAAGFPAVAHQLAADFAPHLAPGAPPRLTVDMSDRLAWDVFHPVSELVTGYSMDLVPPEGYVSRWKDAFEVRAVDEVLNHDAGTRSFTLEINHPGLIWTVISFQAEILSWDMPTPPLPGFALQKIKEASFYLSTSWSLTLTINQTAPLLVNFIGIEERVMWPGKRGQAGSDGPVMRLFERLDGWLDVMGEGGIDVSMFGCVAGAVEV